MDKIKEIKSYNIIKIKDKEHQKINDKIIVEYSLELYINNKYFITLLCTPKSLKELVVGFLNSEGVIKSKDDFKSIDIDENNGKAYINLENNDIFLYINDEVSSKKTITTACGKGKTISFPVTNIHNKIEKIIKIDEKKIFELVKRFNQKSELFKSTGGVHSCAICTYDNIVIFEDDIGRHNALEKVLGKAMLKDMELEDKIILTTGRITSEIVNKAAIRLIPIIVSRSAPTDKAIEIAKKSNIQLIGFVRGKKMNIYTVTNSN